MGKNGIPEQQKFNYGKHREKYQKEIFQLIEDIKNIPNDKKSEEINNYFVIKLYTLLKNFGIYKDYDIYNTIAHILEKKIKGIEDNYKPCKECLNKFCCARFNIQDLVRSE